MLADKTVDFVFNCLNYKDKVKNEKHLSRKEKVVLFDSFKNSVWGEFFLYQE
jgi:hypothetical protein